MLVQMAFLILSILIVCGIFTNIKIIGITFLSLTIVWMILDITINMLKVINKVATKKLTEEE